MLWGGVGGVNVLGSAWERSRGTGQRCWGETGLALCGELGETSDPSVPSILCPRRIPVRAYGATRQA